MKKIHQSVAAHLLQSKAIKLEPSNPFTWASGWKSPIYCDNRITLSYPDVRAHIRDSFVEIINEKYPDAGIIAGVATGAIAIAALVAEKMGLPLVYIRPEPKKHGLGNQIEGRLEENKKVVVIEDLVSTGGSSLKAVEALRSANVTVLGMVAIFTYGFPVAEENFAKSNIQLTTLSNYSAMLEKAVETGYIKQEQLPLLSQWRKDPSNWSI